MELRSLCPEQKTAVQQSSFFIRSNGKFIRVAFADIMYVFSRQNYVQVVTADKSYVILNTMKQMESALPEGQFCRIHRSFIVSVDHITSFDNDSVFLGDKEFPIREQYRTILHQKLNILFNEIRSGKNRQTDKIDVIAELPDNFDE